MRGKRTHLLPCYWHCYSRPYPRALPGTVAFLSFQTDRCHAGGLSSQGVDKLRVLVSALSSANCKPELLLSLSLAHSVPRYFGMPFEVLP